MTVIKIVVWCLCKFAYRQTIKTNGNKITFPWDSVVKNLPANVRDALDSGLIPGSGRFLEYWRRHLLKFS